MQILVKIISGLLLFSLLISCSSRPKVIQSTSQQAMEAPVHRVLEGQVMEFMDASRYTYVKLQQDDNEIWIALPQTNLEKGETIYYVSGIEMHSFESEELDKVFDTLYLVGAFGKTPNFVNESQSRPEIDMHGGKSEPLSERIAAPKGGTSLADLFENPDKFNEKIVLVKGKCVKVNRNIMGKNWVHLQDGELDGEGQPLDLTITTQEEIPLGAIVSLEGIIKVDRDFGSGYKYDLIMEDALLNN